MGIENEMYQLIPQLVDCAKKEELELNIENDNFTNGRFFQVGGNVGDATFVAIIDVSNKSANLTRHMPRHEKEFVQVDCTYDSLNSLANNIVEFLKANI